MGNLCCFSHVVDGILLEKSEQIKPIYMDMEAQECKVTKYKVTEQAPSEFLVSEFMWHGSSDSGLTWGLLLLPFSLECVEALSKSSRKILH